MDSSEIKSTTLLIPSIPNSIVTSPRFSFSFKRLLLVLFPITKSRQSKIIDFPEPVSPVKTFRPLEKNISAFFINNIFVMESDFINFNQP